MKRIFLNWILPLAVFAFFAFVRFYNLENRLVFDWDQEYLSDFMRRIISERDLILIGHRATSETGFFFGPYFEYLMVPFYLVSKLHPSGLIAYVYFLNTAFYFLAYGIVRKLFGFAVAIGFILFWSLNGLFVNFDTTVWAPSLIPVGIIIVWYLLLQIYQGGKLLMFVFLGIMLGFFTQIHSLFFPMLAVAGIFLLFHYRSRLESGASVKNLVATFFCFIVFFAPLVLFDLKHDFMNTKLFFGYFTEKMTGAVALTEVLDVYGNFLRPLIFTNSKYVAAIFHLLFLIALTYLAVKKRGFEKRFFLTNLAMVALMTVSLMRLRERPSEYYFIIFYPLILVTSFNMLGKFKNIAIPVLATLTLIFNWSGLTRSLKNNPLGLAAKDRVAKNVDTVVGGRKYHLSYDMPLGLNNGYDYLLRFYGSPPSGNPSDPLVILRLPPADGDVKVGEIGIRFPKELKNGIL